MRPIRLKIWALTPIASVLVVVAETKVGIGIGNPDLHRRMLSEEEDARNLDLGLSAHQHPHLTLAQMFGGTNVGSTPHAVSQPQSMPLLDKKRSRTEKDAYEREYQALEQDKKQKLAANYAAGEAGVIGSKAPHRMNMLLQRWLKLAMDIESRYNMDLEEIANVGKLNEAGLDKRLEDATLKYEMIQMEIHELEKKARRNVKRKAQLQRLKDEEVTQRYDIAILRLKRVRHRIRNQGGLPQLQEMIDRLRPHKALAPWPGVDLEDDRTGGSSRQSSGRLIGNPDKANPYEEYLRRHLKSSSLPMQSAFPQAREGKTSPTVRERETPPTIQEGETPAMVQEGKPPATIQRAETTTLDMDTAKHMLGSPSYKPHSSSYERSTESLGKNPSHANLDVLQTPSKEQHSSKEQQQEQGPEPEPEPKESKLQESNDPKLQDSDSEPLQGPSSRATRLRLSLVSSQSRPLSEWRSPSVGGDFMPRQPHRGAPKSSKSRLVKDFAFTEEPQKASSMPEGLQGGSTDKLGT